MSKARATLVWPPRAQAAQAARPWRSANWQALGAAFSLEALALAALLTWVALHPAKPALHMLPLEIEAPAPAPQPVAAPPPEPAPPQPAPPQPAPPPPIPTPPTPPTPPAPQPVHPHPPPPRPRAPAPPPAPAQQAAPAPVEQPAPATPAESAAPEPAPAPPPPAPAPASAGPAGPSPEYVAKVRAAVQAAFVYPPAAAALGIPRRTRVAFTLHGVTPANARVLVASGMGLMDRAALQSVQSATYPPPPPEMQGASADFEVWVQFKP